MSRAFARLNPLLSSALDERGWKPTDIQELVMNDIIEGKDRLIIAPTGSGKTMAGILPLFHRCLTEQWEGLSILYITPLRALNRDVDRRLTEIADAAGLSVDVRHGDTSQSQRQKQVRKPPNLLITTPETFQLMFSGKNLRAMIKNVQAVVFDEVHDLISHERGWQLGVGLTRLEHWVGRPIQRLGLSATVGNPNQVALWLSPRACIPLIATGHRGTSITVQSHSVEEIDELGSVELSVPPSHHAVYRTLCDLIKLHAPCLIFVNSRSEAETLVTRLQHLAPELALGVHHGSLATQTRQLMEDQLRHGEVAGLICTSSLELGIDVGSIQRVIQLHSPKSVDRLLQRVGRAEHHVGGVGRGHILSWDGDHLSEAAVISYRAMKGELEPVEWRKAPRIIAANQMVLMVHCFKAIPLSEVTKVFEDSYQFSGWTSEDTEAIAMVLAEHWLVKFEPTPTNVPWYRWPMAIYDEAKSGLDSIDPRFPEKLPLASTPESDIPPFYRELKLKLPKRFETGWISSAGRTRDWVNHHLSMIPDQRSYRVRDAVTRQSLGNVDEAFVLSLNDSGEEQDGSPRRFVIAGRTWMIIDADPEQSELLVTPVNDHGQAPRWMGELPPVPASIAREVGYLRHLISKDLGIGNPDETFDGIDTAGMLSHTGATIDDYPLDLEGKAILAQQISSHAEHADRIPTDRCCTIEQRDDALVVNLCQGSKINETIGHFLLAMASTKSGTWGRLVVEPTRIALQSSETLPEDIIHWLTQTPPNALEQLLSVTLPNSRQVRWRFAQVAKLFGILRHGVDPRRINLQALLRKYRGTVVMQEVLDKLFYERMDIEGAQDVMKAIQNGLISLHVTAPGPLGLSNRTQDQMLLPNWDNAAIRERLRGRLMNERAALCCLRCHTTRRFRVARFHETDSPGSCLKCRGKMLACAREGMQSMLEKWVKSEDIQDQDRMVKNASLVNNRGMEAILCMMGRGIGEATAQRILIKVAQGDESRLLEAIHHAELEYARTRRFWG